MQQQQDTRFRTYDVLASWACSSNKHFDSLVDLGLLREIQWTEDDPLIALNTIELYSRVNLFNGS